MSMLRLLSHAAVCSLALAFGSCALAQEAKPPVYDVVSVKPNDRNSHGISVHVDNSIYTAINIPVKELLAEAYGIRRDLISGGPAWVDSDGFDIHAKCLDPDPHALDKLNGEQRGAMLKPMLAERFQVKVHIEVKTLPVYELVVLKGGPKFSEASPADKNKRWNNTSAGGMSIHNGQLTAHDVPLKRLIDVIAGQLHRGVIDKTGLAGSYDLLLNWTRDDDPSPDATAPHLAQAIEEQLGLKLQAVKGPVETLVIDQVERPGVD